MDCCNYMQYRHHQPYYAAPHYYEPMYHPGNFYGQPIHYQDFYGMNSNPGYYPQQWPCAAASFPDYVYNPKEARIRKAMRDATRERSPMLSRASSSVRRTSHSWLSPHDDLIMSPMGMRTGGMEAGPSVCGFPLSQPSSSESDQFMGGLNSYGKLERAPLPSAPTSVHTNYMQTSPLAQLQQQTEMWPDYPRARSSSGMPFMLGGDVSPYSTQSADIPSPIMMKKQSSTMPNEPIISHNTKENASALNQTETEFHGATEGIDSRDNFMNPFNQSDVAPFDKVEAENKMKNKPEVQHIRSTKKSTSKPLPDFNEAFGSTERGRFQSPPDPRLGPNKGYLDYFYDSSPIKFDDYHI